MGIVSAVIDAREPDWVKSLTFGGVPTLVMQIDTDLLLTTDDGTLIGVERKSVSDFLSTLGDDRLFPQLAKLRELTPWAYLALCGSLIPAAGGKTFANGIETGWNWASVQGALLTVQEMGIHVLQIASDHEYERAMTTLANRDRSAVRVQPARETAVLSDAEVILTSLPGIGPDKAKRLLDYCGSVAWALAYLTDLTWTKESVPGVSTGLKRKIRQALGIEDDLHLWLYRTETDVAVDRITLRKETAV